MPIEALTHNLRGGVRSSCFALNLGTELHSYEEEALGSRCSGFLQKTWISFMSGLSSEKNLVVGEHAELLARCHFTLH